MEPTILTIDDSKTIRMIIGRAFKNFACRVLEAANGVEGLALAAREKPDVIILDITMPIMDGYETLAKLKSDADLKAIPVVMLTAEAGRENVMRIAKMGVRDYLVKPFKEELVVERLSRIIDLQPKGKKNETKRFDDPLQIVVVDDKPAIADKVREALDGTPWEVTGLTNPDETIEHCCKNMPDVVLASLSLADDGAFSLFNSLKSSARTKSVPIFGLCVKIDNDGQSRALQQGFSAVITKPINAEELKARVMRALKLDDSGEYFTQDQGALMVRFPANFNPNTATKIGAHLRAQITDAVDSGLDKVILDLSELEKADFDVIKTGLDVIELCKEVALAHRVVASPDISRDCSSIEEANGWQFSESVEDALEALEEPVAA